MPNSPTRYYMKARPRRKKTHSATTRYTNNIGEGCGSNNEQRLASHVGACLPYGGVSRTLSAKPPLETPSSSLASMSNRRMSRPSPRWEIRIVESLLLTSLEPLRLGALYGARYTAAWAGDARSGEPRFFWAYIT
jgi:hypothetical protein